MNTESVDCHRVEFANSEHILKPGDFFWDHVNETKSYLFIMLPGAGKHPDAIQCNRGQPLGERVWGWDGNEDKPTIHPSILLRDVWHGYLEAGRLKSC